MLGGYLPACSTVKAGLNILLWKRLPLPLVEAEEALRACTCTAVPSCTICLVLSSSFLPLQGGRVEGEHVLLAQLSRGEWPGRKVPVPVIWRKVEEEVYRLSTLAIPACLLASLLLLPTWKRGREKGGGGAHCCAALDLCLRGENEGRRRKI